MFTYILVSFLSGFVFFKNFVPVTVKNRVRVMVSSRVRVRVRVRIKVQGSGFVFGTDNLNQIRYIHIQMIYNAHNVKQND